MEKHGGFSLIEVLVSLMLVTTLGLSLLTQQGQLRQLLTQTAMRAKASQFLDQVDESLYLGGEKLPTAPPPYHFVLKKEQQSIILSLNWFKESGFLIRKHVIVKTLK